MYIDMRGYKVVYENSAYTCLAIKPMYDYDKGTNKECVGRLHVTIINHEAQIDILEDEAKHFAFLKDTKIA